MCGSLSRRCQHEERVKRGEEGAVRAAGSRMWTETSGRGYGSQTTTAPGHGRMSGCRGQGRGLSSGGWRGMMVNTVDGLARPACLLLINRHCINSNKELQNACQHKLWRIYSTST